MNISNFPKISIIVLNWNNYKNTKECLISLQEITYPNYEVIVVDNGSTDGSGEKFRETFSSYTFIAFILNKENLGYTGGNNAGIKRALDEGSDYILILNNDTKIINPDFLTELIEYFGKNKDVGVIGPMVLCGPDEIQKTILYFPFIKALVRERLWPRKSDYTRPQKVESLSGVCLLIKHKVIREVGSFDENYFLYDEETEWCYRVRKEGWGVKYLPVKSILHLGAATTKREPQRMLILKRANHIYTLAKHGFILQATARGIISILTNIIRVGLFTLRIYRPKEIYSLSYLKSLVMEIIKKWRMGINATD